MNLAEAVDLRPYFAALERIEPLCWSGRVTDIVGLLIESEGPAAAIGDFCEVRTASGRGIRTQVIGFRNRRLLSMPLEATDGLQAGDTMLARPEEARVAVGRNLLGRVLDGFARPIDGLCFNLKNCPLDM